MLLRILKRSVDADVADAVELRKLLFSNKNGEPDLQLSVYAVDAGRETQLQAEHNAGCGLEMPRSFRHFDANSCRPPGPVGARGNTGFAFADSAHCELPFADVADLDSFVGRVFANLSTEQRAVAAADVQAYVCSRVSAKDQEWLAATASSKGRSWVKRCKPQLASASGVLPNESTT